MTDSNHDAAEVDYGEFLVGPVRIRPPGQAFQNQSRRSAMRRLRS
ncbi:hypothetical protein [Arthrobacter methylotrophus]